MKPGLRPTGPGVYLMPDGWGKTFPIPRRMLSTDTGCLGDARKDRAVRTILTFSTNHNAWCGVTWPTLMTKIRIYEDGQDFLDTKEAINEMVKEGLLQIPGHKGFWSFLNLFSPKIVCPTVLLLNEIQTKNSPAMSSV